MAGSSKEKPVAANGTLEAAVLQYANMHPQFGQARVASELTSLGYTVSPSGVRYIWKKHDLETAYKRLKVLDKLGKDRAALTAVQKAALNRGDVSRALTFKLRHAHTGFDSAPQDARRDQILKVAAGLFVEHGYGGTSIRDIAQRIGLLPGSVYYHFSAKEDLFVAVQSEGFRQLVVRVEGAIKSATDPWQRLELACAEHIGTVVSGDPMAKMSLTSLFAIHEKPLQKRLKRDRDNYEKIFRRLIDDLDVPSTCDSSIFRLALLGALNWTRVWFRRGRMPPDQVARELVAIFRGNSIL